MKRRKRCASWLAREKIVWYGGSFTVEAAFVVPFGFLVLLSLSCLFQALIRQNDIQMAMLKAVQSYSSQGQLITSVESFVQDDVIFQWKDTEDWTYCYVNDTVKIPFLGSRFFSMNRYQQMAASDYSGVSMVSGETDNEIVYVAENGRVYHRDRECTYLRVRIQSFSVNQASDLRNQSGGKYYPCESCCDAEEQPGTAQVYLTSYGNRYHISRSCSKLKRTVREVHLCDVGNLAPCSKCGGTSTEG